MNNILHKNLLGIIITALMLSFQFLPINAEAQAFFDGPESAVYDSVNKRYLISNANSGNIVQITDNGDTTFFSMSLNRALGMQIVENTLYVASGNSVVGFNLTTKKRTMNLILQGSLQLNDITADLSGNLYVTDVTAHRIYKVTTSDQTYSIFVNQGLNSPNGILFDEENNRLLVCFFIPSALIKAVSLIDASVSTVVATNLSYLDGLTVDNEGNIYVSSWGKHQVFRYDKNFVNPPEIVSSNHAGPGDIFYNRETNILVVPNVSSNSVDFIKINPSRSTIIHVPAEQPTIQAGINVAENGDTVLVAPGIYYENINFRGKNIVVASHYILNNDHYLIEKTIINGSKPIHSDTASCVIIISGEDTTAVLEGFTLTGGTGTSWLDEHGAGTFVEGGGILITLSSPTIKNNLITNNEAIRMLPGNVSAGGGGIRVGDGAPRIFHNTIMNNVGMYGGGIVLNYCSDAIVKNNIIAYNRVYQAQQNTPTFGGGGVWVYATGPNIIENNTIVGNSSSGTGSSMEGQGGGVLVYFTIAIVRNNIIWGNDQVNGGQLAINSQSVTIDYNDIEGGYEGEGNINADPSFVGQHFYLLSSSPCIDAADPTYPFDPDGTRADMGAVYFDHNSPYISYVSHILNDSQNNDNGRADAGETVDLILTLINVNLDAQNVTATLLVDDQDLELIQATANFGDIAKDQTISNESNPFVFSVDALSVAHLDTFYLKITADDGYIRKDLDQFEMIVGTSTVMLVDDDADSSYETHYSNVLKGMNLLPLEWKTSERGAPSAELMPYNAEVVIWFTGDDRDSTLTAAEQSVIAGYLDKGGKLLLTGQNIGYDLIENGSASDSSFYANNLHAQYIANNSNAQWVIGINGDPVTNGLRLFFAGRYGGANNQTSPDVISPISPAENILTYSPGSTGAALRHEDNATHSRLIYLAFGFEGISGPKEDSALKFMEQILNWLKGPTLVKEDLPQPNIPKSFALSQNYPNPFNPTTTIRYSIPHAEFVSIKIYDMLGNEVTTLINEARDVGNYEIIFNGKNLTTGIYICKIQAGNFRDTKKLVLIK